MRYEEYKKGEYDWLPEIPAHWGRYPLRKILSLADERKGNATDLQLLSVYREYGVIPKSSRNDNKNHESEDTSKYKVVKASDIVINKMKLWQGSLGVSKYDGFVSPAYIVAHTYFDGNLDYLNLLLRSPLFKTYYNRISYGIRVGQWDSDFYDFKRLVIPVPPREEQDQIVRYLDWKVSCINKLIHGYQRQIKLLEERRQTVVNDVVVHGISEAPRHRVKAAWMDNVPHNWSEMRMKNFFTEINERSVDGHEPHLSMSQKKGLVTDDENIERRLLSESYAGGKLCQKDDLVLNRLKAHLGVFALAPQLGVISPDYTVLRLNTSRVRPLYAEYLLKSIACRRELRIRVRGIVEGFWRLYTEDLGSIYVCLPPLEEQDQILEYVQGQEKKYKFAIERIEKQIALLKEYRTRLISDVVTGQMDVRGVVIPDYTPEDDTEENEADEGTTDEEVSMDAD